MDKRTWRDELAVGLSPMDEAHQRLADLLDALEQALCEHAGDERIQELLLRLVDHTSDHFAFEQELMRASAYPAYKAHLEEHDALLQHVSALLANHAAGRRLLTLEVTRSLRPWLTGHIEGQDRTLAEYLRLRSDSLGSAIPEQA